VYKLITAPTSEPVTVTELKSQLRITSSSQDTMLGVLITAARQHVEEYLRYSIVNTAWELYLDSFPKSGESIWIQKSPVNAFTSLKYIDTDGVLQTLVKDTDHVVDMVSKPARVYEAWGKNWPSPRNIPNCVILKFDSGYTGTTPDIVPTAIKQAILMIASTLYENPSDEVTGTQVNPINQNSEWLLRPYRAMRF